MVLKSQTNMQALLLCSGHAKVLIGKFAVCGYTHVNKQELIKPSSRVWSLLLFMHAGVWNLHTILIQFVWISNEAVFKSTGFIRILQRKIFKNCVTATAWCSFVSIAEIVKPCNPCLRCDGFSFFFLLFNFYWKPASWKYSACCCAVCFCFLLLLLILN